MALSIQGFPETIRFTVHINNYVTILNTCIYNSFIVAALLYHNNLLLFYFPPETELIFSTVCVLCIVYSVYCTMYICTYTQCGRIYEFILSSKKTWEFFSLLQDTVTEQREFVEKTAKLLIKM